MTDGPHQLRPLVIVVPDKTYRVVLAAILRRHNSLAISSITPDILVHMDRDPGCLNDAPALLRSFLPTHEHALVMFDWHGCGRENHTAAKLQEDVEGALRGTGWGNRAACVVVYPELEAWVWSDSPHVDRCLGWAGRQPSLRQWLSQQGLWNPDHPKPTNPQEAMELALREVRTPKSSSIFEELAASVSLSRCVDPAFLRLRETLGRWFPAHRGIAG